MAMAVMAMPVACVSVMRFQTNGETVSGNVTEAAVHSDAIGKFTLRAAVTYQRSRNGTRDGSCPR